MTIVLKAFTLWFAVLVLAILNGALREKALVPAFGRFAGLIASGVTLSICVFAVALLGAPWYGRLASSTWILIGILWLGSTVAFEFGFGKFVQHKTTAELLAAYTFTGGNIWPVVLVVILAAPWLSAKLRGFA